MNIALYKYDSLLKSNFIREGMRKVNVVFPLKFDTAKSPLVMTSMPISMSQSSSTPSMTFRFGNLVLLGRYKVMR